MAVELAEVAAGLPVAASFALTGGMANLREGRRRAALNEAMHELRRPLQVLSLTLPSESPTATALESSLRLATVALDRLDREINGDLPEEAVTEVSVGELIEESARRWMRPVTLAGGSLSIEPNGEAVTVSGDRLALAQALDNLLSNAVEHGGGAVRIAWRCESAWVRISVCDAGGPTLAKARNRGFGSGGRGRRGHGLRVVRRIARDHGGSFTLRRVARGTEASLRLPRRRGEPRR